MRTAEIEKRGNGDLSRRELEVLRVTSEGQSVKLAARSLGISAETIKDHRRMAMLKLGAASMPHAVALAMRKGVL
jgi:DNA-binding CsgD family transcriptional regulator